MHRSQHSQCTAWPTTVSTDKNRNHEARSSRLLYGLRDGARSGERAGAATPRASSEAMNRTALFWEGRRGSRPAHYLTTPGRWGQSGQHAQLTHHGTGHRSCCAAVGCRDDVQPVEPGGRAAAVPCVSGLVLNWYCETHR